MHIVANEESNNQPRRIYEQRSARFDLRLPVRFRVKAEGSEWKEATSRNVSGSGMLFIVDQEIELGAELELCFTLKADRLGSSPEVVCSAKVVRVEVVPWPEVFPAVGAQFLDYRFVGQNAANA